MGGDDVSVNMNPLRDDELQYNGDDVANLIQLNSGWALDGLIEGDKIQNSEILNDLVATKHYPE